MERNTVERAIKTEIFFENKEKWAGCCEVATPQFYIIVYLGGGEAAHE